MPSDAGGDGVPLDRLTHKAHILEFVGESFRFRERMQREAQEETRG